MNHQSKSPGPLTFSLLRILSDGEFHSGEFMARDLNVSRSSVNSSLQGLEDFGLTLHRIRGRGYRLVDPPQFLDTDHIRKCLGTAVSDFNIEVLNSAASSNTLLLQRNIHDLVNGTVLAVELQTDGRGRLGRTWYSGLGNSLTFSLLWKFERGLTELSGLGLVVGLALLRGLKSLGIDNLKLKWPNDIVDMNGNKIGGILIEARGEMLGTVATVIGIGLNLFLPRHISGLVPGATGLKEASGNAPDRNRLLAVLLLELRALLHDFAQHGFGATWREEWEKNHLYQGARVRLILPNEQISGIVLGVTNEGALELETSHGPQIFHAGEISLRSHE